MVELQAYLDSVRHNPFVWGQHDCASFIARWWDLRNGTVASAFVASFACTTERKYRQLLRNGETLETLTTRGLGVGPVDEPPQHGDVVLAKVGRHTVLCIAVPPLLISVGPAGLTPLSQEYTSKVWRSR